MQTSEISRDLFDGFIRKQEVNDCWRKENGAWCIKPDPFLDDWSEEDYEELIQSLKECVSSGGILYGAFVDGKLKGFSSVEPTLFGKNHEYLDLTNIHVSQDVRRRGIGTELMKLSCKWAKDRGAKKLYISAHSAVETQSFYRRLGCKDAEEISEKHAKKEPFDVQMELVL